MIVGHFSPLKRYKGQLYVFQKHRLNMAAAQLPNFREIYPNFDNADLPHHVDCSQQDYEDRRKPFIRIAPAVAHVHNAAYYNKKTACLYVVLYCLKDGSDLSEDARELYDLIRLLTKYKPSNTRIICERSVMPKFFEVTYLVSCNCDKTNVSSKTVLEAFEELNFG